MKTEITVEIIGNTKNIGDTNDKGAFCIVKAEGCLYDDNMNRSWLKNPEHKFAFRLFDDDKALYFTGYSALDSDFVPLDYYGDSYGCTEIQYKVNGRWTTL